MNNYCRNCGNKINIGENKCSVCNTKIIKKRVDVNKIKNEKKMGKKYLKEIIILFILRELSSFISYFEPFTFLFDIALFVLIISASIKLPNNKVIEVLSSYVIINFIITLLLGALFFYIFFKIFGIT